MIFLSFRNGKNTLSEQLIAGEAEAIALTLVSFTRIKEHYCCIKPNT
jgi:hypothetical protein